MSGCVYLHCECCLNVIESVIAKILLEISNLSYTVTYIYIYIYIFNIQQYFLSLKHLSSFRTQQNFKVYEVFSPTR